MIAKAWAWLVAWWAVRRFHRNGKKNGGYGSCFRCGRSWSDGVYEFFHMTYIQHDRAKGCFPLCERCWLSLTPEGRIPYYAALILGVWHESSYHWAETLRQIEAGE